MWSLFVAQVVSQGGTLDYPWVIKRIWPSVESTLGCQWLEHKNMEQKWTCLERGCSAWREGEMQGVVVEEGRKRKVRLVGTGGLWVWCNWTLRSLEE